MIRWVNKKYINTDIVNNKIQDCLDTRHLTNYGKNVLELQERIKKIFNIDDDKEVILVNNGASGLQALVGGLNTYFNKKLKFICQSFTFPCSKQGLLMDSIILDIDKNMGPDIDQLNELKDEFDGIIITNCFGCSVNISVYEEFCAKYNKLLIFDNAASPYSLYNGKNILNYGNGSMISFHHTKSVGFGEGGAIIFDKKYLDIMNRIICFGFSFTDKQTWYPYASNFKMSELNAIFINDWLNNLEMIFAHHSKLITYFISKKPSSIGMLTNYSNYSECLNLCIPITFKDSVTTDNFIASNIEAKKYYYPLDDKLYVSKNLYDRIICLPLTIDMTCDDIDKYIDIIQTI
jgi:dTDP-4-amino-4,6-dideoxygalactose transaminase